MPLHNLLTILDRVDEMAKDMKSYKYESMWAEDTADIENGINDVDDFVTGYVRTNKKPNLPTTLYLGHHGSIKKPQSFQ